jgi:hypothetical protein
MPLQCDQYPPIRPERQAISSRWLARCLVVGTVGAASLAMTACGSTRTVTILNTEKVERAIEKSSLDQRGKHVHVSCPPGVHQKRGLVFSCAASDRRSTRFVVTQMDDSGRVHYEAP